MTTKYNIFLETKRRAFQRGETAALCFNIKGRNAQFINDCRLEFKIGIWESYIEIDQLKFFTQFLELEVDTNLFKIGEYKLQCILKNKEDILGKTNFDIFIAKPIQKERLIFWHWPSTVYYNALETNEELGKQELRKIAELGFTHAQLRADWAIEYPEAAGKLIDYALTLGLELGGLVPNYNQGPFNMTGLPDEAAIVTNVSPFKKIANPYHPAFIKRSERWLESMMNVLKDYPSCSTIFMNSELEDQLTVSIDADSAKMHASKLGFSLDKVKHLSRIFSENADEAEYIQAGVIADNDPEYLYSKYYFKHGDGWVSTNKLMTKIIHEFRPDITVIADPLRLCSLYGRFDGVDAVSSWTYSTPDPKMMLFNETLRCEATPEDKQIIQTITMYNYGGSLIPSESGRKSLVDVLCMGAGRYLESAWINISRAPDGIGIYFSSQLEPTIENVDEHIRPQETFDAVKDFAQDIIQPFGQVFRNLKTTSRRVAVLDSWASRVYGKCPRPYNHYQNYFIYDFYILLNMAHLPADVIFEETIIDKGLDDYDMLVMPCCDTLPESVYRKVLEFEKAGGKVVADQWLRAEIPNTIRFDFDFTYRNKVNADAINKGTQFASNEDTAFKAYWETQKTTGVTAEEDRDIIEQYCTQLRKTLDTSCEREVDCNTPRVLLNRLDSGDVKYLSLVNDKRTYDERVGQYKAILSKGLPQKAVISWKGLTGREVLYDLINGKEMVCECTNDGEISFEITLPASGGALIAAMPDKLTSVQISYSESIINLSVQNAKGLIPLEVNITDPNGRKNELSGYFTLLEGNLDIPFTLALDDVLGKWLVSVKNLCNNETVEAELNMRRK